MGWILINTEQDGQAVDIVEKAAEKFETYKTLIWINDKDKKLTNTNLQFYKWNGERFEGEEPESDPDASPEEREER